MGRKQFFLILLILLILSLTACWDYTEYENMALISVLGIDMDEQSKQISVSLQYMIPGGSSKGGSSGDSKSKTSSYNVAINTASGSSVDEALTKIQQDIGKRLFFGYMEALIIGETAAKSIMEDIMGLSDRTPEIRASAYLLIVQGKAVDAVSTVDPDVPMPAGRYFRELVESSNISGNAYPVIIEDFIENLQAEGREAVAPRIITTAAKNKEKEESESQDSRSPNSRGRVEQKEGHHRIDGIAVFKQEKLVGWLDGDEGKGLAWIMGIKITPYESYKTSDDVGTEGILFFKVSGSKSKIKIRLENGKPIADVNVYAEADLRKYAKTMEPQIITPYAVNMMQDNLQGKLSSEIDAALQKGQKELKSDIFGFGKIFYRQHLRLWRSTYKKDWEDIFPELTVKVNVHVKVINTGTSIMKFFAR